jgi:ferredoxin-NADP reductase
MAVSRTARVVSSVEVAPHTRHVTLEMLDGPLGFVGGQYVIIDSGLVLPSGKAVKRAFSILSADSRQEQLELAVLRLPEGPGSGFVHGLAPGAVVRFSGPWGKMRPSAERGGPLLVLATDTGVTAALGLVRGQAVAPLSAGGAFVWLRTSASYFLPASFVVPRLPPRLGVVEIGLAPPVGHPERIPACRQLVSRLLRRAPPPQQAFFCGDGAVNYALLDDLAASGLSLTRDNVESFFNMPKKAAPPGGDQALQDGGQKSQSR